MVRHRVNAILHKQWSSEKSVHNLSLFACLYVTSFSPTVWICALLSQFVQHTKGTNHFRFFLSLSLYLLGSPNARLEKMTSTWTWAVLNRYHVHRRHLYKQAQAAAMRDFFPIHSQQNAFSLASFGHKRFICARMFSLKKKNRKQTPFKLVFLLSSIPFLLLTHTC